MARTKKAEKNNQKTDYENSSDNKSPETEVSGDLGTQGFVNVALKRGKVTVYQKQFKNSGLRPLFHFIAQVLGGVYVPKSRPTKLILLYIDPKENTELNLDDGYGIVSTELPKDFRKAVDTFSWERLIREDRIKSRVQGGKCFTIPKNTGYVPIIEAPLISKEGKVTFAFRLPFSSVVNDVGTNSSTLIFNAMALMPERATMKTTSKEGEDFVNSFSDLEYALAYYLFTKIGDDGKSEVWDEIAFEVDNNDLNSFTLYVEWAIKISNKN